MNTVILGGSLEKIDSGYIEAGTVTIQTATESGRVNVVVHCAAGDLKGLRVGDHVVILAEVRTRLTRAGGSVAQTTELSATHVERYRESMGYTTTEILDALRVKW